MTTITLNAPAKINLWLEIKGKRPDGYHDIESVMQTVTLFDRLTLERHEPKPGRRQISISCSQSTLACDESNLCYRAAQEFFGEVGQKSYNLFIHIDKQIPIAAGLAGGSTDAAATLIGLNTLWETGLSAEALCAIGARIGADVPFCIRRGISVARGIGEVFADCARLPDCWLLIACDGEGVSTPWAYRQLDSMYDFASRDTDITAFCEALSGGRLDEIAARMTNIFETAVLPVRERASALRQAMVDGGALSALMSGSGPSVFGLFADRPSAETAKSKLASAGIHAYLCEPYYEK
ncbi:MAG: 4-(cytidine 5'-diphospho)-2-C-methyl-D-erythritol kinase [Clostridia bacterium]|nr:4-(cytidine 5'-diphospho)-2-C-methyl-D-erythritol kinase [Clostridia bacterium]